MIPKKKFRNTILQYRMLMDETLYYRFNTKLCESVSLFIEGLDIQEIHIFLPIKKNKEPDVTPLLSSLWSKGIKIIVSKTDFAHKKMTHFYLEKYTKLGKNSKEIPEPIDATQASIKNLDAILIPLLICDKVGYRIGYGGGYYDRLLREKKVLKIGLSLSAPVDKLTQMDKWDVPLDFLITPFKIYNCYG